MSSSPPPSSSSDDVFSDVSLFVENQRLFFPSSHGDDQEDQHYDREIARDSFSQLTGYPSILGKVGPLVLLTECFCPVKGNEWAAYLSGNSQQ